MATGHRARAARDAGPPTVIGRTGHVAGAALPGRSRVTAASNQSKQRVIDISSKASTVGFPFESRRQTACLPTFDIPSSGLVGAANKPVFHRVDHERAVPFVGFGA
jgi:hypothetical protein